MRRMTEHDHRYKSTARGAEERSGFLRLQAGLTHPRRADELGTMQATIARLERGVHCTSPEATSRVATALARDTAMLIEEKRIA